MPGGLDSLRKCDEPSHLYTTQSYPLKGPKRSVDTIESAQQQINRQVNAQFKSKSKPVFVFILVSASKLFFIVIIFPPYFIFYGMPRWVAKELAPRIGIVFAAQARQLFLQLTALIKAKFIFPFHLLMQKCNRVFEHVRTRLRQLRKKGERAIKQAAEPLLHTLKKSYAKIKSVKQTFLSFFSSQHQRLKNQLTNVQAWRLKLPKIVARKTLKILYPPSLSSFLSLVKTWVANKGKEVFKILRQENVNTKVKAEKIVQEWKKVLRPYANLVAKKLQSAQLSCFALCQQLTNQLADWAKPAWMAVWSQVKNGGQALKTKVAESSGQLKEGIKMGLQWGRVQLAPVYHTVSSMAQSFLNLLPPTLMVGLSKGKELSRQSLNHLQKVAQFLVIKSLSLKHKVITALQKIYLFVKSFKEKGKHAFQKVKKQGKAFLKQLAIRVMQMGEKSAIWLIRFLLWLRLAIAWLRVLSRYGIRLLPLLTEQLLRKFRLRSN